MSVSEAHKRANEKYDKKHMGVIGIKAKKEIVNYIKLQAKSNDLTAAKICINAVMYCFDNGIELKDYDSKTLNKILSNTNNFTNSDNK